MTDTEVSWQLFICRACGLIYDEQAGDPDSGIAPGTRFEDIPDDWTCPLCGVGKADFEPFERPVIDGLSAQAVALNDQPGIIVIGAGIAGWTMVEAIRQLDPRCPIILVTACHGDVYHKPELSLAIGRQLDATQVIREQAASAATRLGVNLVANTFVVGVSTTTKTIRTTRGTFPYTQLIIAQGSKAQLPAALPEQWCWRINHLASWSGLQQALATGAQRVAIIGAGMIGCELAENLSHAGHQVHLMYRSQTPLPQVVPTEAGGRLQACLEQQGVQCLAQTEVDHLEKTATGYRIHYSATTRNKTAAVIEVDQIVAATGLVTDQRLARMAQLDYCNGITVDQHSLQTSQADIYALGDCISIAGQACRFIAPIEHQARVIAAQICDTDCLEYQHCPPVIRLKVQSCSLVLQGQPEPGGQWQTIAQTEQSLTMEQRLNNQLVSRLELAQTG